MGDSMTAIRVNADNFVRAETARMFDGTLDFTGGINVLLHNRSPVPLDRQTVIRMNRDTLYSTAIVDIRRGATLTLPETGGRYISAMVVNEDHYINDVLTEPGEYRLTLAEYDTPYVAVAIRTLVDPSDPDDLRAVHAIQDGILLASASRESYSHPDYDPASLDVTRSLLLSLSEGLPDSRHSFGRREDVDPVRHLLGTASGWGGLPEYEAFYFIESAPREAGRFQMTLRDVPADAFWSVTIYNRDGFLEENEYEAYSINSLAAETDEDGSTTLNLAPERDGLKNFLFVMDGWNYALRLYRPRPEVLDGSWTPPVPVPSG